MWWAQEAEALGEAIRRKAGVSGRVPPSAVAKALGFGVRVRRLEPGLLGYHLEGSKRIVVADCYAPRREASIAHELAEAFCERRDCEHEHFCERAAASISMPASEFILSLWSTAWDVPRLRSCLWPWASWEAIVLRTAELMPGIFATAWVDDCIKWRSGKTASSVTHAEIAAARDARGRKSRGVVSSRGTLAVAWRLPGRGAEFRAVGLCFPARR